MSDFEHKLAELKARFRARARDERRLLAAAFAVGDTVQVIERAHKLAGIAGMLGAPQISDAAIALEEAARSGQDHSEEAATLIALLAALET